MHFLFDTILHTNILSSRLIDTIVYTECTNNEEERKMTTNQVEIIKTESRNALHCHYSGQTQRQGCYLELDCANRTLSASYNAEIGNAIPFSVYHGHDQRFGIGLMRGETADALMEEILPLAQRVVDGYESHWDGNNHVARFTDDADDAIEEIERRCMEEEGDLEVYEASDWIEPITHRRDAAGEITRDWTGAYSAEIEKVGTITAKTTDDELSEMESKIDAMAEGEGILLNGVGKMLEELRSDCEEDEDE